MRFPQVVPHDRAHQRTVLSLNEEKFESIRTSFKNIIDPHMQERFVQHAARRA